MRTPPLLAALAVAAPLVCGCGALRSGKGASDAQNAGSSEGSASGASAASSAGGPDASASSADPSGASPASPASSNASDASDASSASGAYGGPGALSSADITAGEQALEARKAQRQLLITGVVLTSVGALSAAIGGGFLGRSGGFCHSYNDSCGASVGLPIVGALWIGAGVLPLVLGVSILVPKVNQAAPTGSAAPSSSSTSASARPSIIIGPAGAGVRVPF